MSMEHMEERWKKFYGWFIRSNGEFDWIIAEVQTPLPGDETGEATARAIVAEHNAAIDRRDPEKMRAEFEAWAIDHEMDVERNHEGYMDWDTGTAWCAWKGARK